MSIQLKICLLAVIIGAFVFGIGIVLAGGLCNRNLVPAAEGLVGSWVALFTYMLLSAIMRTGPLGNSIKLCVASISNNATFTIHSAFHLGG